MKRSIIFLLFTLFVSNLSFGQKEEKIFYNSEWKGCSAPKASYYRIVKFDNKGKPIGLVRDYFISGELQAEVDGAILIDRNDDSKSIFIGLSKGYFKSGVKQFEKYHDSEGNVLKHNIWFENGNKKIEAINKNGKLDGDYTQYYERCKLFRKFNFKDGIPSDRWFIECDELNKCQRVFFENFYTKDNINQWGLIENEKDYYSKIIPEKGLLMQTKTDKGFRQTI